MSKHTASDKAASDTAPETRPVDQAPAVERAAPAAPTTTAPSPGDAAQPVPILGDVDTPANPAGSTTGPPGPTRAVTAGTTGRVEDPPLGREVEPAPDAAVRTLTQEEVNRLLGTTRQEARQRLLKELGGFESAEQAKSALGAVAEATARAQAAEEQRDQAHAERVEAERTWHEAEARLQAQLADVESRAAVYAEASRMGFRDPSDAYQFLGERRAALAEAKDPAAAVHEALEDLAKDKPYLLVVTAGVGVTNPGRQERSPESDAERRRRLYGTGGTPIGRGPGGGVFMPEGYRGTQ